MPLVIAIAAAAFFLLSKKGAQQPAPAAPVGNLNYSGPYTATAQNAAPAQPTTAGSGQLGAVAGKTAIGVGDSAIQGAIKSGLGGAAGAAVTGLETAGIGAAVFFGAEAVSNVIKCGTLTQEGCDKRSDSSLLIDIRTAAEDVAYSWEAGQATTAAAVQALQQLGASSSGFKDPQRSWLSPSTYYRPCGSFSNNGKSESGAPCSSAAAQVIPQGASVTGPQMIQAYIAFVSGPQPSTSHSPVLPPDNLRAVTQ